VNTIADVFADPQLRHRGMIRETADGTPTLGNPIKLSATPPSLRTPPPVFGEHTDTVLAGLGIDAAAIAALRAAGTV
jgi:formyl-CoA transferase/CoA:oxalate CoA-transferase